MKCLNNVAIEELLIENKYKIERLDICYSNRKEPDDDYEDEPRFTYRRFNRNRIDISIDLVKDSEHVTFRNEYKDASEFGLDMEYLGKIIQRANKT